MFLRINDWQLQRPPMQIHAEMIRMLETGTFDTARLDPWLRAIAVASSTEP
jgi:death-on-curing protein